MRKLLVAVLLLACSGLGVAFASQALAAARTLNVGDDYFVRSGTPPTVTVRKGTRVTWKWVGRNSHNVAVSRGPVKFRSSIKRSGTYSRVMRRAGTYRLICTIHAPDMRMTLKVTR